MQIQCKSNCLLFPNIHSYKSFVNSTSTVRMLKYNIPSGTVVSKYFILKVILASRYYKCTSNSTMASYYRCKIYLVRGISDR